MQSCSDGDHDDLVFDRDDGGERGVGSAAGNAGSLQRRGDGVVSSQLSSVAFISRG